MNGWSGQLLDDKSCSQGFKKQWKQAQRPSSTAWPQWPGIKIWHFFYVGEFHPGNKLHRVREKAAELLWEHSSIMTHESKCFVYTSSEALPHKRIQERKMLCLWHSSTACQKLQEQRDSAVPQEASTSHGRQNTNQRRQIESVTKAHNPTADIEEFSCQSFEFIWYARMAISIVILSFS